MAQIGKKKSISESSRLPIQLKTNQPTGNLKLNFTTSPKLKSINLSDRHTETNTDDVKFVLAPIYKGLNCVLDHPSKNTVGVKKMLG